MKTIITMALLCASAIAAEPAKKELTADEKLQLARLQLQLTAAQARAQEDVTRHREGIQALDKQYLDLSSKLKEKLGAGPECGFNDKQDLVCPPPPAPAKPEVKK